MKRPVSEGVCQLCQGNFTKNTITRHLQRCLPAHEPAGGQEQKLFHLVIAGYGPYWLHVEMPGTSTFADLDRFLRHIWLECCGHMSQFLIKANRTKGLGIRGAWGYSQYLPEDELMDYKIAKVLEPKLEFAHEYDMGSTTKLRLKVADMRVGKWDAKDHVRLLARNLAPEIVCSQCGKPAKWCDTEYDGFLCDACRKEVGAGECLLPVVNSPRMGVCGYSGRD